MGEKPLDVVLAQLELLLLHGHILIRPDDEDEDEAEIVEDNEIVGNEDWEDDDIHDVVDVEDDQD